MMRATIVLAFALAGCLDAPGTDDMALDLHPVVDMTGADYSLSSNCLQLNQCLAGPPACMNQLCVDMCRNNATPSALMKQDALQACFDQHCMTPCTPDKSAPACTQCLANAQAGAGQQCTPPGAPECHACINEAVACRTDHT